MAKAYRAFSKTVKEVTDFVQCGCLNRAYVK